MASQITDLSQPEAHSSLQTDDRSVHRRFRCPAYASCVQRQHPAGHRRLGCPAYGSCLQRQQNRSQHALQQARRAHPQRGIPPHEPRSHSSQPLSHCQTTETPPLHPGTYLDHSGATIYARSTLDRTTTLLLTNLYGNPHSANQPAQLSGDVVDAVRLQALRFLGADPAHFDLVFTANATSAIKLVADAFRDLAEHTRAGSFWYGYHREAHTSLVGVRELAARGRRRCFEGDGEVEAWLDAAGGAAGGGAAAGVEGLGLFAYPGQSNLTGRRLPLGWAGRVRAAGRGRGSLRDTYCLMDAAALAMTSSMGAVFADPEAAPDFVCVSFYKIFGFPDLGGLVVRRDSGHILTLRKYFGGGTVSMVSTVGEAWHTSKGLEDATVGALHEGLEDGTLPFHSIIALGEAIGVHAELYGSMESISAHTTALARRMYLGMRELRHGNGHPVCKIYEDEDGGTAYGDPERQGATIAFNVFRADGGYEPYATVERLANEKGVYVRSGGKSGLQVVYFRERRRASANWLTQGFVAQGGCTTHCNTNLGSCIGPGLLDIIAVG